MKWVCVSDQMRAECLAGAELHDGKSYLGSRTSLDVTAQVLTYGLQNNDPAWVRKQYSLGVQGAIVDDVAGVISAFGRPQIPSAGEELA